MILAKKGYKHSKETKKKLSLSKTAPNTFVNTKFFLNSFKIKYDLRILLETGMILLIVCGVVLIVSIIGARMYILFKK